MGDETVEASDASQNEGVEVAGGAPGGKTPLQKSEFFQQREDLLADIDAKIAAAREADDAYAIAGGDVLTAARKAAMEREAQGATPENPAEPVLEQIETELDAPAPVVQPRQRVAPRREATPIDDQPDPLADYIVQSDQGPMFKTVVDGRTVMVPLERARATLQKNIAADSRLVDATRRQKELDAREANIRQTEQTLRQRAQTPPKPAYSDEELEADAVGLVRSLVSEPEEAAGKKLAAVLKKARSTGPAIDVDNIVARASDAAVQKVAERDDQKAFAGGYSKFRASYPDIMADSGLYHYADSLTEAIHAEHPDWDPETVMMEAGNQTRAWVAKISGKKPQGQQPKPRQLPNGQTRQQVKQNLRPMPTARSVPLQAVVSEPDEAEGRSEAFADVLKSRGQAS